MHVVVYLTIITTSHSSGRFFFSEPIKQIEVIVHTLSTCI